jgi:hypothetical protein
MDYQTGEALHGEPSHTLVEESLKEQSGTGAVYAYLDGDVWQYVPASQESRMRARGSDVRTVWVQS